MPTKVITSTQLTEITPIGSSYFHQYKLNNEYYNIECTKQEYEALSLPGAGAPKLPVGATWVNSFAGTKFNTPSGRIENNQYCSAGSLKAVKLPGSQVGYVTPDKIVSGTLDATEVAKIIT